MPEEKKKLVIVPEKKQERPTVGKVSRDLLLSGKESADVIEIGRDMQKDYMSELFVCIDEMRNRSKDNFFVVVITKRERLMPNVFRNFYLARTTCPTPDYDQSVFKYHQKDDSVEYIWTIPDKESCFVLKQNALQVVEKEQELLKFVLEFSDGTLMKKCQKLNGEKSESLLLDPNA